MKQCPYCTKAVTKFYDDGCVRFACHTSYVPLKGFDQSIQCARNVIAWLRLEAKMQKRDLTDARDTIARMAEEIARLRAERSLSFPCVCGFGSAAGIEFIDSGTLLQCEKCGAHWRIDLCACPACVSPVSDDSDCVSQSGKSETEGGAS